MSAQLPHVAVEQAKAMAENLKRAMLAAEQPIPLQAAQHLIAAAFGCKNWQTLTAARPEGVCRADQGRQKPGLPSDDLGQAFGSRLAAQPQPDLAELLSPLVRQGVSAGCAFSADDLAAAVADPVLYANRKRAQLAYESHTLPDYVRIPWLAAIATFVPQQEVSGHLVDLVAGQKGIRFNVTGPLLSTPLADLLALEDGSPEASRWAIFCPEMYAHCGPFAVRIEQGVLGYLGQLRQLFRARSSAPLSQEMLDRARRGDFLDCDAEA